MEEELAWETDGCESQCEGRWTRWGPEAGGETPRSQRAAQGEAGPSQGHRGLGLLCGSVRNVAQAAQG